MLESLRRSIGMHAARFHFRSSHEEVISFSHSISTSERVLVIMPLKPDTEEAQTRVLTFLREHFYEPDITVIAMAGRTPVERVLPRCRVLLVGPGDVNVFFLPRRAFLTLVAERSYDLALDLNLDFMVPSAYICKESNARVRTGFSGGYADSFYNFQVRLEAASRREHAYDRLVHCLEMFFSAEEV